MRSSRGKDETFPYPSGVRDCFPLWHQKRGALPPTLPPHPASQVRPISCFTPGSFLTVPRMVIQDAVCVQNSDAVAATVDTFLFYTRGRQSGRPVGQLRSSGYRCFAANVTHSLNLPAKAIPDAKYSTRGRSVVTLPHLQHHEAWSPFQCCSHHITYTPPPPFFHPKRTIATFA